MGYALCAGLQFSNTHTPPHGLSGLRPTGSGSSDSSRIPNERRFSWAAVCNRERVSTDFHPHGKLTRAYHRKVSEWHPDKLNTMAQELRDYATRRTARINEAYDRLRSSWVR